MDSAFAISLVYEDASELDIYADMLQSLHSLSHSSTKILERLEERIILSNRKLNDLQERVLIVKHKVKQIAEHSDSAVTIFSPSKHPLTSKLLRHQKTFQLVCGDIPRTALFAEEPEIDASSRIRHYLPPSISGEDFACSTRAIAEISQVLGASARANQDNQLKEIELSLGAVPRQPTSVSELFLFNSKLRSHGDSRFVDNLASIDDDIAERKRNEERDDLAEKRKLFDAPVSIREADVMPEVTTYDIEFKPQMKPIAHLRLPSRLDLPDIANLEYNEIMMEEPIAPSLQNVDRGLPKIKDTDSKSVEEDESIVTRSGNSLFKANGPNLQSFTSTFKQPDSHSIHQINEIEGTRLKPRSNLVNMDVRKELLASIRDKGNISRLRKQNESLNPTDSSNHNIQKSLSLAEEMRIKLRRRQKALSGQQDEEERLTSRRTTAMASSSHDVDVMGKMRIQSNGFRANEGSSDVRTQLFALENVNGINDLLSVRENRGNRSYSTISNESNEWDEG